MNDKIARAGITDDNGNLLTTEQEVNAYVCSTVASKVIEVCQAIIEVCETTEKFVNSVTDAVNSVTDDIVKEKK